MNANYLRELLLQVASGEVSCDKAMEQLKSLPYEDMGFAKVDLHRELRTGFPEVIFGQGKTPQQIAEIFQVLAEKTDGNILATRCSEEAYQQVLAHVPNAVYHSIARAIYRRTSESEPVGRIAVVSAGTADMPVAEEAALTAELMGNRVDRIYDSGVAGIHRLLSQVERLRSANVVVAVAGMEGALASVVGGLVCCPVIAVPTSVGYGANLGGIATLLAMLNSCAAGITVVNIDNGFGAGYAASMINRLGGN